MYLVDPILQVFYRHRMAQFLQFAEPEGSLSPPPPVQDVPCFLYIHIPFCETLCPYCSFHRCEFQSDLAGRYFDALRLELLLYRQHGYDFQGVYIGGGTPTILMDRLVETLELLRESFSIREVSLETNPNHVTPPNVERLRAAGVNRLSVGVQSFDDHVLKHIGRYDKYGSGADIERRIQSAVGLFDTLNVDLIFNIPCQTKTSLERDLEIVNRVLPEQVTTYPLMAAPSVERAINERVGRMHYERERDYYFTILERTKPNYRSSTAWCFSRKATMIDEYIINYENYVGAGSGAFGYLGDALFVNTFDIGEYVRRLNCGLFPIARHKRFAPKEKMYYYLLRKLFALRLPLAEVRSAWGARFEEAMRWELLGLKLSGAIRQTEEQLIATEQGQYYLVMAMREFFIAVDTLREQCRHPHMSVASC